MVTGTAQGMGLRIADVLREDGLWLYQPAMAFMAVMLAPILTQASQHLWERLGQEGRVRDALFDENCAWGRLARGFREEGALLREEGAGIPPVVALA